MPLVISILLGIMVLPACDSVSFEDSTSSILPDGGGQSPGGTTMEIGPIQGDATGWFDGTYDEIVVTPDGGTLLALTPDPGAASDGTAPSLVLVAASLPDHRFPFGATAMPLLGQTIIPGLDGVVRLAFAPDGETAYLLASGGTEVAELDLATLTVGARYSLTSTYHALAPSPDGKYLVLESLGGDDSQGGSLGILHLGTGIAYTKSFDYALKGMAFSPIHDELVVSFTEGTSGGVIFFDHTRNHEVTAIAATACPGQVALSGSGSLAMVTSICSQDPTAVIDVGARSMVDELPVSGALQVARDGSAAMGKAIDSLGDAVVVIRLQSLEAISIPLPGSPIALRLAPSGTSALVTVAGDDADTTYHVDLLDETVTPLPGEVIAIEHGVWVADSDRLLVLEGGTLVSVSMAGVTSTVVGEDLPFGLLATQPEGDFVILGATDSPTFALFDPGADTLLDPFTLGALPL